MILTHVTERGLERLLFGASRTATMQLVRTCDGLGIFEDEVATGGSPMADGLPTCPVCAVMRDAALEGRLLERKDASHGE